MIKIKMSRIESELKSIHNKIKITIGIGVLSAIFMATVSIGFIIPMILAFKFYKKYDRQVNALSIAISGDLNIKRNYKINRNFIGNNNLDEVLKMQHQGLNMEFMEQQNEFNRQMVNQQQDEINRQMQEQFDREFIDFSNKSVTSFDDGGFVQGPGFNLSDTMMSNMNNGF